MKVYIIRLNDSQLTARRIQHTDSGVIAWTKEGRRFFPWHRVMEISQSSGPPPEPEMAWTA